MTSGTTTVTIVIFVLVVFPIFFAALWVCVTVLMSFIGGWGRVAKNFAAVDGPPQGKVLRHVTGMFGVARYKRVLTVVTTKEGIYIATRAIFRPGHPPIFVPFSAIRNPQLQTLFFWEYLAFDVGDPPLARVRLPSKIFEDTPLIIAR